MGWELGFETLQVDLLEQLARFPSALPPYGEGFVGISSPGEGWGAGGRAPIGIHAPPVCGQGGRFPRSSRYCRSERELGGWRRPRSARVLRRGRQPSPAGALARR